MLAVKCSVVLERRRRVTLGWVCTRWDVAREVATSNSEVAPSEEVGVKTVDRRLFSSSLAEESDCTVVDFDVG